MDRFRATWCLPHALKQVWWRLQVDSILNPEKRTPLKRVGKYEELDNPASFFISDFAEYINGEVVTLDAGKWLKGAGEFNGLDEISTDEWNEIEKSIRKK